jgi:hypothetical protein
MTDLFPSPPGVVSPPAPGNGAIRVGSVPKLHRGHPDPVRRSFRRNFLDRQDPFETAGHQMRHFTFPGSYELHGQPGPQVVDEIQTRMVERLVDGNLAGAEVEVIDFDDAGFHEEPARRFIVTHTDTRRRTLVTVNAYVQASGDHLYYSVRSYILPPLSIWKLLLGLLFTWLVFTRADVGAAWLGMESPVAVLAVSLLILAITFRNLIRNLLAGDTVLTALRKQFPRRFDWGTFNDDDVAAFLKTSLQLTLGTIASVLEAHGIEVAGLKAIMQNLQTVNIHMNNGNIVGAIFGGTGNVATGKVGP